MAGGLLVFDQAVQTQDVFPALAGGQPVVGLARFIGRQGEGQADDRIHRPLGDGVAGEEAVLGVLKGAFPALEPLLPHGKLAQPFPLHGHAPGQEIAGSLVVDHGAGLGVVAGGIPQLVAGDSQVKGEKQANFPGVGGDVGHHDFPDIEVLVKIHGVVARQGHPQARVGELDVGHQGVRQIAQFPLPIRSHPGELPVDPDPQAAKLAAHVIFETHMGEIKLPDAVVLVKTDEQFAVADGEVSGHGVILRKIVAYA